MININLLPSKSREERLVPVLLVFALLLVNVLSIYYGYSYIDTNKKTKTSEDILSRLENKQVELENKLVELSKSKPKSEVSQEEFLQWVEMVRLDVTSVLDEVHHLLPVNGNITEISLTYPGELNVSSTFTRMEDAAIYLNRLRKASFVEGVVLQSVARTGQEDTKPSKNQTPALEAKIPNVPIDGQSVNPSSPFSIPQAKQVEKSDAVEAIYTIRIANVKAEKSNGTED